MAVTISQSTATLHAGYRLQLTATCSLGGTISWSTSNATQMTVAFGLVKCMIGAGYVTITATSSNNGNTATCVITGYGVGVGFVSSMIGMGGAGDLCAYPYLNEGSLYRPRRSQAARPEDIYSSAGDTFYKASGCGLALSVFAQNSTVAAMLTTIDTGVKPWAMELPRGVANTEKSFLGDFRGYQHSIRNKSAMKDMVVANPTVYQLTPTGVTKTNWDGFVLENLAGDGVLKYSDIWTGATAAIKLSDLYLTCLFHYPARSKYWVKSFGPITQNASTWEVAFNLEDFIINTQIDDANESFFTDKTINRYYFLTTTNFNASVPTEISTTSASVVSVFGATTAQLLLVKPGSISKYCISNVMKFRTCIAPTIINNTAATQYGRSFTIVLSRYILTGPYEAGVRIVTDTKFVTIASDSSEQVILNGIFAREDPTAAGTLFRYEAAVSGIYYGEILRVLDSAGATMDLCLGGVGNTPVIVPISISMAVPEAMSAWNTAVLSWKVSRRNWVLEFKNVGDHTPNYLGLTGIGGNGTTVTATFATQAAAPYAVGSKIVIAGCTPTGYNGGWTVTSCGTTYVSWASAVTGTQTVLGAVSIPMDVKGRSTFSGGYTTLWYGSSNVPRSNSHIEGDGQNDFQFYEGIEYFVEIDMHGGQLGTYIGARYQVNGADVFEYFTSQSSGSLGHEIFRFMLKPIDYLVVASSPIIIEFH